MMVFIAIIILGLALAAILALELGQPEAPLTKALRAWQSGLGALVGLLGIALSVSLQSYQAERLERTKVEREGIVLALSMQHEAFGVRRWLKSLDSRLANYSKDWEGGSAVHCQLFFSAARQRPYDYVATGIIESQRTQVGKLPNLLGVHFMDVVAQLRSLIEEIASTTDEECKNDPKLRLDVLKEAIGNVRTALDRVQENIMKLPQSEVRRIAVEY